MRPGPLAVFAALLVLPLAGCGSLLTEGTADVAGIAGAGIASSVTKSATAAAAIGLGVRSAANAGLQYVERRVHKTEQDAIARAAGPLAIGEVGVWRVVHSLPIEADEAGEVVVSRDFGAPGFRCREIVFSVDTPTRHGLTRDFYTATICQDGTTWHWASAEPATARWGGLQ